SFSGSTLVSIFSDRLEIVSLGGLVPGLEPEDIFEGISQTRNVGLANIFYRLNYIEAYGTGIRKIRKECETMGVSADFRITNAAFRVIIPNRNVSHSEVLDMDSELSAALNYIRLHAVVSRKELQEVLGIKQTKCGLLLKALKEKGLIVQKGSGKATRYVAKR
ncbi:MAG: ATP-binding protein, partial [Oscillospiraceae bacterium]|nr:ATP-binding protein [Oscillospiraceae bacterium]